MVLRNIVLDWLLRDIEFEDQIISRHRSHIYFYPELVRIMHLVILFSCNHLNRNTIYMISFFCEVRFSYERRFGSEVHMTFYLKYILNGFQNIKKIVKKTLT